MTLRSTAVMSMEAKNPFGFPFSPTLPSATDESTGVSADDGLYIEESVKLC